jgi:hypothetical protein
MKQRIALLTANETNKFCNISVEFLVPQNNNTKIHTIR